MNRVKINAIITVFVLLAYIACVGVSFASCKVYKENEYSLCQNSYFNGIDEYIYNRIYEENQDEITLEDIVFGADIFTNYPHIFAVYDENANLLVSSDFCIRVTPDNQNSKFICLSPYMTDKLIEEIREYSYNSKSNTELLKVDYCEIGEKLVPVNIYLKKVAEFNEYKKFNISDYKATNSYYYDEWYTLPAEERTGTKALLEMNYYNLFDNKINTDLNNKLSDKLTSPETIKLVKKALESECTLGEFGGSDRSYCADGSIIYQDKQYAFYYECTHNIYNDVLTSYMFNNLVKVENIIFIAMAIVLFVICNIYYSKSQRLSRAKNAFISAAAHELKTPIAAIENNSECLIENINPDKNQKYLSTIHNESIRMNKLVATLLQYNRLISSTQISKTDCSLTEMLIKEAEQYADIIEEKGIIHENKVTGNDIRIKANEDLIALVIDNFLSNAVKHTDAGNKIAVGITGYKNGYKLFVFNEGKQIDCKYKKNLWEVFYRSDKVRNSKDNSTGMGLAISKQILDLHKFNYGFINKENGVEFYFITK